MFKTLETELEHGGLEGLRPIDRMDVANGMAVSHLTEMSSCNEVGLTRSAAGRGLTGGGQSIRSYLICTDSERPLEFMYGLTMLNEQILKSDFFSGLQKQSLPE